MFRMRRFGRYDWSAITLQRLSASALLRARELPHALAWYCTSAGAENRRQIRRFRGIHAGQRGFILANGPSLRRVDLSRLGKEVTFGLNRIYLLFESTPFRPTYYVAMNELVLEQFAADIQQLAMPKFLNWNRRACFAAEPASTSFLKSRLVFRDSFQRDLTAPVVVGATVTFVALQIAFYMGFSEIVILGLDHQYAERGTPSQTEVRTQMADRSHFHENYFPAGSRWQLPDLLRAEIDFELARRAYEADGRRVLDATDGGHCPVFMRAELDALLP